MALRLKDEHEIPQERFQFPVAATGFTVEAPNFAALYPKIVKHCESNNVPTPSLQEVVNWICANLSVICYEETTREPLLNRWAAGMPSLLPVRCCGSNK